MPGLSDLAAHERLTKKKLIRELVVAGAVAVIGLCFLGKAGAYLRDVAEEAKLQTARAITIYQDAKAMEASVGFVKQIAAHKFKYPVEGMSLKFGSLEGKIRTVNNGAFIPALKDPDIAGLACEQTTVGHIYIHTVESLDPLVMDAGMRIKRGLLLNFCDDAFAAAGRASLGTP